MVTKSYSKQTKAIIEGLKQNILDRGANGVIVEINGLESAVIAVLCAKTKYPTSVIELPLESQQNPELKYYSDFLKKKFKNVTTDRLNLTPITMLVKSALQYGMNLSSGTLMQMDDHIVQTNKSMILSIISKANNLLVVNPSDYGVSVPNLLDFAAYLGLKYQQN